jgi:hypothetical protein
MMRRMAAVCGLVLGVITSTAQTTYDVQTIHATLRSEIVLNAGLPNEERLALPLTSETQQIARLTASADGTLLFYCANEPGTPDATTLYVYSVAERALRWSRPLERGGFCTFGWDFIDGDRFFMSVTHYSLFFPPEDASGDVYTAAVYRLSDGSLIETIPAFATVPQSDHAYANSFVDGFLTLGIGTFPYKGSIIARDLYLWHEGALADLPEDGRAVAGALQFDEGVVLYLDYEPSIPLVSFGVGSIENVVIQEFDGGVTPLFYVNGWITQLYPLLDGSLAVVYSARRGDNFVQEHVILQRDGSVSAPRLGSPYPDLALLYTVAYAGSFGPFISADNLDAVLQSGYGTACEAQIPSRLPFASDGRVIGGPSNLRREAARTSAIIGRVPDGATFSVIGWPSCDAEGILWWFVEYTGQRGYIAELQGDTYFVEPVFR